MRIRLKDDVNLHWWGDRVLLVYHRGGFYALDEIETQLVQYFQITTCIEKIVEIMSEELGVDQDTVVHFITIFLENFHKFMCVENDVTQERIKISGEYNAFYPLEIHISMTDCCTQNCRHCYKRAGANGRFIHYEDLSAFLQSMVGKVPYLVISGGEPTIHPNFCDLLHDYGDVFCISVLSSGYELDWNALDAIRYAKDGLTVSVYSSDSAIHDAFTGTIGSFKSVMRTIDLCKEMEIPIQISTILTETNFDDMEKLIHQLSKKGVKYISVGTIAPVGRAADNELVDGSFLTEDIRKKVIGVSRDNSTVVAISSHDVAEASRLSSFKCSSGTLSWSIFEDGEIQPCGLCRYPELKLGSIGDHEMPILYTRDEYEAKISKVDCIKRLCESDQSCPFFELCKT